jgi:hypothetical protein
MSESGKDRHFKIYGYYSLGNILAVADIIPELTADTSKGMDKLRTTKKLREETLGEDVYNGNKHLLTPKLTIMSFGNDYYAQVTNVWEDEEGHAIPNATTIGESLPITRERAMNLVGQLEKVNEWNPDDSQ